MVHELLVNRVSGRVLSWMGRSNSSNPLAATANQRCQVARTFEIVSWMVMGVQEGTKWLTGQNRHAPLTWPLLYLSFRLQVQNSDFYLWNLAVQIFELGLRKI